MGRAKRFMFQWILMTVGVGVAAVALTGAGLIPAAFVGFVLFIIAFLGRVVAELLGVQILADLAIIWAPMALAALLGLAITTFGPRMNIRLPDRKDL